MLKEPHHLITRLPVTPGARPWPGRQLPEEPESPHPTKEKAGSASDDARKDRRFIVFTQKLYSDQDFMERSLQNYCIEHSMLNIS